MGKIWAWCETDFPFARHACDVLIEIFTGSARPVHTTGGGGG